ncbi:Nuclear pore protein 84/107 [Rhypophila sp. PSN 637]
MAPAYDFPGDDSSSSNSDIHSDRRIATTHHSGFNEIAALEETYQKATYQDVGIQPDEAVSHFADELDRYTTDLDVSPAEKRAQVLQLVDSYYNYTRRRANQLQDLHSRQQSARHGSWQGGMEIDDDEGSVVGLEELRRAEEEAQTWDLLRRILPLRHRDPAAHAHKTSVQSPTRSRKEWWDEFIIADSFAKERKVVLEWLQNSASHGPPVDELVSELQQNAERGDILAHGWLHTRSKIKLQKSVNGYQGVLDPNIPGVADSHLGSNTLITQLDPDSMTRQTRRLEPQDEFFERAIWLGCFEMLRRGYAMSEIRDWCLARTELWRAAAFAPLPLSNPEDEDEPDFDPASMVLWNRVCYKTSRDGGTSDYDKAVYGLLAGDVDSVERVSKSWDDFLFAHYNALLRMQFDSFLIKHAGEDVGRVANKFAASEVLKKSKNPRTVGKDLISRLETDPRTRDEASRTLKLLQGVIIANELDQHLHHQGVALGEDANKIQESRLIPKSAVLPPNVDVKKYIGLSDHDSMRILTHILIIDTTLDRINGFSAEGEFDRIYREKENIIAGYISYLRLASLEEMIPLYCSKLHGHRVYETLSRNLIHIGDNNARVNQLKIMRKLHIDIAEFAKAQPAIYLQDVKASEAECEAKKNFKILEDGPATLKYGRIVKPDFFGLDDALTIDQADDIIIRSLEWLMLVPGLLKETCEYVILAYKYFLKRTHLTAARALSDRVSGREILRTKTSASIRGSDQDGGPGWFDEFASSATPAVVDDSTIDWEELTVTIRNLWELECLVNALDIMETLSSLAGLTREENSNPREVWLEVGKQIRLAKECMKPVLKNWLLSSKKADKDFKLLREAYIPETVMVFVSSLHFVGTSLSRDNLLECMELAAVIAEKGSDLAQEFIKCGRMKELLEAFASCSKALAIWTSDKKSSQPGSKKMREMGWSRELWAVKP